MKQVRDIEPQVVTELAAESLERAGFLRLRVTGNSMRPSIRPGSHVRIRRAGPGSARPGDIVLVRADYGFRLHRLVHLRPGSGGPLLITRGDNQSETDPPEPASRLLGVVVHIEKPRVAYSIRSWMAQTPVARIARKLMRCCAS